MSLIAVFIASLIGSPHCAGMCGGFVAFYAARAELPLFAHFAYNFGRLFTYLLLGLLAGFVGQSINDFGIVVGLQQLAAGITGVLLIVWGIKGLYKPGPLVAKKPGGIRAYLMSRYALLLKDEKQANWTKRALLLGMCSTLLPCSWLYTFAAVAAASGSALKGALVMLVFWTGTIPIMASVAGISKIMGTRLRAHLPRLTAALLIVAGLFSLLGHQQVIGLIPHQHGQHSVSKDAK